MKCDVCKKEFPTKDFSVIADATEGVEADDMRVCPTCFVEGVVEGYVTPNPEAFRAARRQRGRGVERIMSETDEALDD